MPPAVFEPAPLVPGSPGSVNSSRGHNAAGLRRGKSADQYVEMRLRHIDIEDGDNTLSAPGTPSGGGGGAPEQASPYEEVTIRTINPRRKLRRLHDRSYENCEPTSIPVLVTVRRDSDVSPMAAAMDLPAPAIIKEVPLSPTHYQQPPTPDHPPPSAQAAERSIHERIRPLSQVSSAGPCWTVGAIVIETSCKAVPNGPHFIPSGHLVPRAP